MDNEGIQPRPEWKSARCRLGVLKTDNLSQNKALQQIPVL
jgi:hypothetical protein